MILDNYARLADSQTFSSDAYGLYSYDLANVTPKRNVGAGTGLALVWNIESDATVNADTIDLQIVTSANANLTSDIDLASWRIAGASLTSGAIFVQPFPAGKNLYRRYVGCRVEVGTGDSVTASCHIVPMTDVESHEYYADAVTYDA